MSDPFLFRKHGRACHSFLEERVMLITRSLSLRNDNEDHEERIAPRRPRRLCPAPRKRAAHLPALPMQRPASQSTSLDSSSSRIGTFGHSSCAPRHGNARRAFPLSPRAPAATAGLPRDVRSRDRTISYREIETVSRTKQKLNKITLHY